MKQQKYFIIAVCIFFAALWIGAFIFVAQDNKTNELEVHNKVNAISSAIKKQGYDVYPFEEFYDSDEEDLSSGFFLTKTYTDGFGAKRFQTVGKHGMFSSYDGYCFVINGRFSDMNESVSRDRLEDLQHTLDDYLDSKSFDNSDIKLLKREAKKIQTQAYTDKHNNRHKIIRKQVTLTFEKEKRKIYATYLVSISRQLTKTNNNTVFSGSCSFDCTLKVRDITRLQKKQLAEHNKFMKTIINTD